MSLALTVLLSATAVFAANAETEIIFLSDNDTLNSISYRKLQIAGNFYGINTLPIAIHSGKDLSIVKGAIEGKTMHAIVVDASSLRDIPADKIREMVNRNAGSKIPICLVNLSPQVNGARSKEWLEGRIDISEPPAFRSDSGFYRFFDKAVSFELGNNAIAFERRDFSPHYDLELSGNAHSLMKAYTKDSTLIQTIFAKSQFDSIDHFFISRQVMKKQTRDWQYCRKRFCDIAPYLMFIKAAFRDYCWHAPADYANLTIDDPWLTEPYGHLSFSGLLREMEKVGFHTTIAFVPWNFDRNRPDVVELFNDSRHRFSLVMHGNNHDHREFCSYHKKPFHIQEFCIKQGVARMAKMQEKTGLKSARVMSFPHGISPSRTLLLLKKYNFNATFNVNNTPVDITDRDYRLRDIRIVNTDHYAFPSVRRIGALKRLSPIVRNNIVIDLFLDNPVLWFAHHEFFSDSISEFNKYARHIHEVQPQTKWSSLGEISEYLYLRRLRNDGSIEIRAFSSRFILRNDEPEGKTFHICKNETFELPIQGIYHNDSSVVQYSRSPDKISIEVDLPANSSNEIKIVYKNEFDPANIDVSKKGLKISLLRRLSDFRDLTLGKSKLGSALVAYYYESDVNRRKILFCGIGFGAILILVLAGFVFVQYNRK